MKLAVRPGSTDVSLYVFIQDSSSSVGAGLTGLVFNSAGLVAYYVRPLGNATQLTLMTQTVTGAHSDGGFVEVSSANMPGIYRLDLSDAIIAAGVRSVVVMLKGATNMAPVLLEIDLGCIDDIADGVFVRDWTAITATVAARSALNALRLLRNKWAISGGTLSVKKEDDTTEAWAGTVTSDAGAAPIIGNDPA